MRRLGHQTIAEFTITVPDGDAGNRFTLTNGTEYTITDRAGNAIVPTHIGFRHVATNADAAITAHQVQVVSVSATELVLRTDIAAAGTFVLQVS